MKPLSWRLEGRSGDYTVTLDRGIWSCTCPSQQHRGTLCRHCRAVSLLQRLALLDREAVDALERLAKEFEQREVAEVFGRMGHQPEPEKNGKPAKRELTQKEKLDAVFGA